MSLLMSAQPQVAFSPNSRYVAVGSGNVVCIWDLQSYKEPSILSEDEHDIETIAFSPDGSVIASASRDGTIRIWEAPWGDEHKKARLVMRRHPST